MVSSSEEEATPLLSATVLNVFYTSRADRKTPQKNKLTDFDYPRRHIQDDCCSLGERTSRGNKSSRLGGWFVETIGAALSGTASKAARNVQPSTDIACEVVIWVFYVSFSDYKILKEIIFALEKFNFNAILNTQFKKTWILFVFSYYTRFYIFLEQVETVSKGHTFACFLSDSV